MYRHDDRAMGLLVKELPLCQVGGRVDTVGAEVTENEEGMFLYIRGWIPNEQRQQLQPVRLPYSMAEVCSVLTEGIVDSL